MAVLGDGGLDSTVMPVEEGERRRRRWTGLLPPVLLLVVVLGALVALLVHRSSGSAAVGGGPPLPMNDGYDATLVRPARPAPPLALRNYLGQSVNIRSFRGRAVLVTFLHALRGYVPAHHGRPARRARRAWGEGVPGANRRGVGRPKGGHPPRGRRVPRTPPDGGSHAVPRGIARGTPADGGRLEHRVAAGPLPPRTRRAFVAPLRHHGERQARDDLPVVVRSVTDRPRRARARVALMSPTRTALAVATAVLLGPARHL